MYNTKAISHKLKGIVLNNNFVYKQIKMDWKLFLKNFGK